MTASTDKYMLMRWISVCLVVGALLFVLSVPETAAQSIRSPELNVQFHRAETALRVGGSMGEAKTRIDHVIREVPEDVEARKLRAQILLEMDRASDALMDAQYAVYLRPEDAEAHLLLCEAARRTGDNARAVQALKRAAEQASEDAELHLRLSWNAMQLDELEHAEALGRVALRLDENRAAAYYQLARVFVKQDRPDHAANVLVRGFEAEVISREGIEQDETLSRIANHAAFAAFFEE